MDTFWAVINIVTAVMALATIIVEHTEGKKDDLRLAKIKKYVDPVLKILSYRLKGLKK
jgi:hypothetical protein|tara:strand:+ start:1230 stop:1403 length:174 start_codon:yes stop_codon:yes gene_type:complete